LNYYEIQGIENFLSSYWYLAFLHAKPEKTADKHKLMNFILKNMKAVEESADMMRKTEVDVYDIPIDQPIVDPDDGDPNLNTEEYDKIVENEFLDAQSNPIVYIFN
jgi:hypothetical protein